MISSIPTGWLPADIDLDRRRVSFVDAADQALSEPFTAFTVEKLRPTVAESDLSLIERSTQPGGARYSEPTGILLHTGRCGSTLLSNMLGALERVVVIRELPALNELIGEVRNPREGSTMAQALLDLESMIRFLSSDVRSPPRIVVLKLASWSAFIGKTILGTFPKCRAIFLWRDPVEVVRSYLASVPRWAGVLHEDRASQMQSFPSLVAADPLQPVTAVELYVAAWRTSVQSALTLDEDVVVVDYADLVSHPSTVFDRVCSEFRLGPSMSERNSALRELRRYSKSEISVGWDRSMETNRPELRQATVSRIREETGDLVAQLHDHST